MTYCVAWKSEDIVFLVADSALTSNKPPQKDLSSFGENHIKLFDGTFSEEALFKIHKVDDLVFTYAGSVDLANRLRQAIEYEFIDWDRTKDFDYEKIISGALLFISGPLERDLHNTKFIFAYKKDGLPKLGFYENRKCSFDINDRILQIGSVPWAYKIETEIFLKTPPSKYGDPNRQLVNVLAIVQSYCINDNLMRFGVGGTVCGAYYDENGFHWQPDILYNFYSSLDPLENFSRVITLIRHDCLMVSTTFMQNSDSIFLNSSPSISQSDLETRINQAAEIGVQVINEYKYDYVIFFHKTQKKLFIIDMRKNSEHGLFQIVPKTDDSSSYVFNPTIIRFSKLLREPAMNTLLPDVYFFAYQEKGLYDLPERVTNYKKSA